MDKIDGFSLDLEKQNINKIKELFPEAIEEGKINFEMLRTMLGDEVDDSREKYQFTWNGKAKSIKLAQTPSSATLRPCKEKSKDWDTTENLYIEGDNLEVLKQLQKTYYGKIKMIYIDPPYNTGNDFVYNDSFSNSIENYKEQTNQVSSSNPESNGRFHTDWLNMMYPRLMLAKNLLSDDGVIFISIDDNEYIDLTEICDEIFGSSNRIGPIIQNKLNAKNDTINIQKNHEYILVYRKMALLNGSKIQPSLVRKVISYKDVIEENERFYYLNDSITTRGEGGTLNARPNLGYTIYFNPETKDFFAVDDYDVKLAKYSNNEDEIYHTKSDLISSGYIAIRPPHVRGKLGCWTWSMEKFNMEKDNIVITGKVGSYTAKKRTFIASNKVKMKDGKLVYPAVNNTNSRSIIDFSTNDGTNTLNSLIQGSVFNNPKNLSMITYLQELLVDKKMIILDFFSGSATTAHAVMKLNAEDGGNRKFIMVQLPELCSEKTDAYKAGYKNICEIGEERIRRAGEQIKSDWGKEHPSDGLFSADEKFNVDIGFKVFKLDSSNVNEWDSSLKLDEKELAIRLGEVFKSDRSKEDILYEIMLKYGVFDRTVEEIAVNGKTMYRVGKRYMIVCLEDKITTEDVKAIGELSPKTVIFKESGFSNDNEKINTVYNLEKCGVDDIKCI